MRYKMIFKYDGSKFHGFQRLNNKRSVQKEHGGSIETGENLLPVTHNHSVLPCGIFGRWIP